MQLNKALSSNSTMRLQQLNYNSRIIYVYIYDALSVHRSDAQPSDTQASDTQASDNQASDNQASDEDDNNCEYSSPEDKEINGL